MLDRFNRNVNYLRISVTDRCNQRCVYCMPKEGVTLLKHEDILSFEQILQVVKIAVAKFGINKVRLTGGEPLIKRDIISLVLMIANVDGVEDLSMTTNGVLLNKYALPLKEAGLDRLNVSLDSVDRNEYKTITRCDNLERVLKGLDKAKKIGFRKIKLNCVIAGDMDRKRGQEVKKYADKHGFELRFIRQMDISKGEFWQVEGGDGGNCKKCNRLRLSSDGRIFPCLFSDISYSIKEPGIEEALKRGILNKPESGETADNNFSFIGG
ncbi:MAG: radical SAM protein [Victivallales bacterium]|nr:radical SAM protein [Victivallales bacterium]